MSRSRILAIVPARAGSKRIPGKNLRLLGGRSLVERALDTAVAAETPDHVVLSSDDPTALEIAEARPGVTPLRRPKEISGDRAPAVAYVRHALDELEGSGEAGFGIAVIVQPSSPFTLPEDVDATVRLLLSSGAESAASVVKLDHAVHPAKLKRLEGDRLVPYLEEERGRMAEHELPDVYVRNGSVYATVREVVFRDRILGEDCRGYVMPADRSLDINEEWDLRYAEFLLAEGEESL